LLGIEIIPVYRGALQLHRLIMRWDIEESIGKAPAAARR
jgi:hypothetical protein